MPKRRKRPCSSTWTAQTSFNTLIFCTSDEYVSMWGHVIFFGQVAMCVTAFAILYNPVTYYHRSCHLSNYSVLVFPRRRRVLFPLFSRVIGRQEVNLIFCCIMFQLWIEEASCRLHLLSVLSDFSHGIVQTHQKHLKRKVNH